MKNGYISTHKIDSDKNITDDKNVENSGSILSDEKYKIFIKWLPIAVLLFSSCPTQETNYHDSAQ